MQVSLKKAPTSAQAAVSWRDPLPVDLKVELAPAQHRGEVDGTRLCPLCTASVCLAHPKCVQLAENFGAQSLLVRNVICLVTGWHGHFLGRSSEVL